jgi:hypothetical protein
MRKAAVMTALLLIGNSSPRAQVQPPPASTGKQKQPEPEPLSQNCQANLNLTEEVTRLLSKAASHATKSSACVDGPGMRVAVDQVLVCPVRQDRNLVTVDAIYRITRWAEGDTRRCGRRQLQLKSDKDDSETKPERNQPDLCSGTPAVSKHRMRFSFKRKGKNFRIEVPKKIQGFSGPWVNMTPLDKVHNGGCYGKSGPFVPARIRLNR